MLVLCYQLLILSVLFRVAIVLPSDPVHVAAKKMRELLVNSVVIATGNKVQGILTYYSFLLRIFLSLFPFSFKILHNNILGKCV